MLSAKIASASCVCGAESESVERSPPSPSEDQDAPRARMMRSVFEATERAFWRGQERSMRL